MYEAAFKNIDNTLREDDGCGSELDYIEQTSWVLFLKYLDDFESEKANRKKRTIKTLCQKEIYYSHVEVKTVLMK